MRVLIHFLAITFILLPDITTAQMQETKLCFGKTCILAEVANTPETRARGLMFRENLPENNGMLFVFEKADFHAFWMKNMNIALDFIWLDQDKRVLWIDENILPCVEKCPSLVPTKKIKYVLEVNAGWTKRHNIKVKNKVVFN